MKKLTLLVLLLVARLVASADEGMWIPMLVSQNFEAMQRAGLKLTPEQIYSINNSSLKDAVVHFGGGCTGEIISGKGLLLTNHHCGYGNVAALSTVENNYLMNGYMAKSLQEELPCPGLSVKFLVRIEDVTARVNTFLGKAYGKEMETRMEEISKEITKTANENGTYECDVKSYFAGNKYLLLVYQRFTDIRLVSVPPENLGKYGGDTDNWMWPRHTCDYSMFRVYANNDNKPAPYSINNRPFEPRHHLPVSLKGVKENDYAMIMGYPGRTTRYLPSYGVDLGINVTNPAIVKIRDKRLAIMREEMEKDPAVDLAYASSYAQIANYWKYFIGQTEQLKNLNILGQKQKEEAAFQQWANSDYRKGKKVLSDFQRAYADYQPYAKHQVFYREAFMAPSLTKIAMGFANIESALKDKVSTDSIEKLCKRVAFMRKASLNGMNEALDRKVFSALNLMYYQDVPKAQHPDVYTKEVFGRFGTENWQKTFDDYTDYVYSKTALLDSARFASLCNAANIAELLNDPAIMHALSVMNNYKEFYQPKIDAFNYENAELSRAYQGALLEKNAGKQMYPDANSTMRVTYGNVKSYSPKDAISYNYYTVAEGLLEKYKAGDKEFDLQPNIVELLKNKDYGPYIDKEIGSLVTCFITNNDITGGNSGSPVMNANGELIGCAFDGNWEAMSGDIAFDSRFKRTICADIRYILWVMDKVLGGRYLMDEMSIRN